MDIPDLATRIASGDRRALARAITLVESRRADHRAAADDLLAALGTARTRHRTHQHHKREISARS